MWGRGCECGYVYRYEYGYGLSLEDVAIVYSDIKGQSYLVYPCIIYIKNTNTPNIANPNNKKIPTPKKTPSQNSHNNKP